MDGVKKLFGLVVVLTVFAVFGYGLRPAAAGEQSGGYDVTILASHFGLFQAAAANLNCFMCHGPHPTPQTYQLTWPVDADLIPCYNCHEVRRGFGGGSPGVWRKINR